jgi:hypothetical protein
MSSRQKKLYDIVILGASGFTGSIVTTELACVAKQEGITWAVAGRNKTKLHSVLRVASKKSGEGIMLCVLSLVTGLVSLIAYKDGNMSFCPSTLVVTTGYNGYNGYTIYAHACVKSMFFNHNKSIGHLLTCV